MVINVLLILAEFEAVSHLFRSRMSVIYVPN